MANKNDSGRKRREIPPGLAQGAAGDQAKVRRVNAAETAEAVEAGETAEAPTGGDSTAASAAVGSWFSYLRRHWATVGLIGLLALGTFGAGLKYLEESAQREKAAKVGKSSFDQQESSLLSKVNPFVEPPPPSATPQLSKEYIYAGSRMLAVEDANASAAPPADLAVWRPSTGVWYVLSGQGSQQTAIPWGGTTNGVPDIPVPDDYDGDGKTDFSVFRPGNGFWYVSNSSNGGTTERSFGTGTDKPAAADYDGDGRTDMAVYRPSEGKWYINPSSNPNPTEMV